MESWLSLLLLPVVGGNLLPENWIIDHGNHKHKNVHLDPDWSQKACQEGSHCIPVTYSSLSCSAWSNIQSTVEVKPIFDALQCGYLHEEPMVCIPSEYISRVPLCDIFQIKTETTNYNITTNEAILILGSSLNKTGQLWNTLSPPVCGTPILDLNRISGGQDSAPGEWPWMASLMYKSVNRPSDDLKFLCGGSLVSSRVVLTAAHCVNRTDQNTLEEVRLGENDFRQLFDCKDPSQCPNSNGPKCFKSDDCVPPYQSYKVDRVVKHPGFRKEGKLLHQDLALVFLDKVVQVTDQVQPACLPSKDFQMDKVKLKVVTGWGNTNGDVGNARQANILQQLRVELVTTEDCGNIWGFKNMEVTDDLICARSDTGEDRESVCGGDSGGPLVYSVNGRHYVQHGVVSVGAYECGDQKPTLYAALNQDVVEWITNTVGKQNLKHDLTDQAAGK